MVRVEDTPAYEIRCFTCGRCGRAVMGFNREEDNHGIEFPIYVIAPPEIRVEAWSFCAGFGYICSRHTCRAGWNPRLWWCWRCGASGEATRVPDRCPECRRAAVMRSEPGEVWG